MVTSPLPSSASHSDSAASTTPAETPGFDLAAAKAAWRTMSLPKTALFGTDGIRGRAGELLNPTLALQVGFWAGQVLRAIAEIPGPVIVGQDSRNSSDMLASALSAGLTAAGLEVWNLGLCPTPGVAYLTHHTEAVGGVMISASHNPPEDNGIKFFGADGAKLPVTVQAQIEAMLRGDPQLVERYGQPATTWGRHYHRPELAHRYLEALHQPLAKEVPQNLKGMRVVLDLAWGAAARLAPAAFQALGAEVICLHDQPDGDRINVNCGSTHLGPLQAAVKHHQADVGFAFDGDADRVLAVDCQGRAVDGDYILFLWGEILHAAGQLPEQTIVSTVMANLGFERAWQQQGGTLIRTAVGDQYVHAEMLRTGSMLGGEQSGHILCRHYGVSGDGLLTALHLASLVKQAGVTLTHLVNQSFQTYPQVLKNIRFADRTRLANWQHCDALQSAIAQAEVSMGDQGRVLVRASGTEPLLRIMVEAAQSDLVDHWANHLVAVAQQQL